MNRRTSASRVESGTSSRFGVGRLIASALLGAFAFVQIFPLYWLLTSALKSGFEVNRFPPTLFPSSLEWDNVKRVFYGDFEFGTFDVPFGAMYLNSLYIALVTVVCTLCICTLSGYAFARIRFRGRTLMFVGLLSGLLIPTAGLIVPLYILFRDLGLIGTHVPLIVEPAFGAPAVVGTFVMRQCFLGIPGELEDAGRLDGLGRLRIFLHIALPLARPAIASVVILTFLASWNMILEPLVLVSGPPSMLTVPVGLTMYVDTTNVPIFEVQMAATALSVLPILVVFFVAQRQFVQGIANVGLRG